MATIASLGVNLSLNSAEFTASIANAERSAQMFTKRIEAQAATFGMTEREARIYGLAQRGAGEESLKAARAADALLTSLENNKRQQQENEAEIRRVTLATEAADEADRRYIKTLQTQAATFGMTTRQAEIFRLEQNGASAQTIAAARGLDTQITALETKAAADAAAKIEMDRMIASTAHAEEADRKYVAGLRTQIATHGMSARKIEIYKLAQNGASAETLSAARAADMQLTALEKQKKGHDGLIGRLKTLAIVTAAVGVAMGVRYLENTMEAIDATGKLSDRLGVTTENLVRMRHVADLAGVGNQEFDAMLEKMTKTLGGVTEESGPVAEHLARVGIRMADIAKLSPDEAFLKIADAVSKISDPLQRASLATSIFGRSGQALLNTLMMGSAAIREQGKEADALGLTYSRGVAASIEEANDNVLRMTLALRGVAVTVAGSVAPAITSMSVAVTEAIKSFRSIDAQTLRIVGSMLKWTAIIAAAVTIAPVLVGAIGSIVTAMRALAVSQAIVAAFSGPAGLASLAAGAVAATAAVYGISKAFNSTAVAATESAEATKQAGAAMVEAGVQTAQAKKEWEEFVKVFSPGLKLDEGLVNEMNQEMMSLEKSIELLKLYKMSAEDAFVYRARKSDPRLSSGSEDFIRAQFKEAEAAKQAIRNQEELKNAVAGTTSKLADQVQELELQAMGWSSDDIEIFRLQLQGASADVIANASALAQRKRELIDTKKAQDDLAASQQKMKNDAQSIFDATRTPMERYEAQIDKLSTLLNAGELDWDTYGRAVRKAREELEGGAGGARLGAELGRFAFAGTVGSKSTPSLPSVPSQTGNSEVIVKGQDDANKLLREIARNTKTQVMVLG